MTSFSLGYEQIKTNALNKWHDIVYSSNFTDMQGVCIRLYVITRHPI